MPTDTSLNSPQGAIVIDGISYIPSSVLLTGIPKISFKDNSAFAVVDSLGEAPRIYSPNSELGFYYRDTRYLGIWETTFNGMTPVPLTHELRFGGNTVVFSMTNRDFPRLSGVGRISRDTFLIRRVMCFYDDVLFETIEVKNFDNQPHSLQVEQWVGGRFEDVFEVRGYARAKRGRMLPSLESFDGTFPMTTLQYEGLDQVVRKTFVHRLFEAEKIRVSPGLVGYFSRIEVPPKGTIALKTIVSFEKPADHKFCGVPYSDVSIPDKMKVLVDYQDPSHFISLKIETDNAIFNRAIENAQKDIYILLTEEDSQRLYPYAGIPWFSAPFGRDGIITAYQMLPWYPNLAAGVLDFAFKMLGEKVDAFTDEQPGKVFHELRRGEMSKTREVPFIPYYGSVDSTPLCLILLYEYVLWTMDLEKLKEWWPYALRALEWMNHWGDADGDGFLEYAMQSSNGLVNQGWKDSSDSIMHEDGRLAEPPIRLCEAQGYSYRARMGMSALARLLGHQELGRRLRMEALELKSKFTEKFWDSGQGIINLALVGKSGEPCRVKTSNMGHCLWSHILQPGQAKDVAHHLISPAMFSGFGIRTLADTEKAYNPLSYHNGSVWPHDNSIIMEGFRSYGFIAEMEILADGLMGVLESSDDFRLPELFCGFRRRGKEPPVPYEVACKPQAWAAGSVYLMIKSMLGMSMETDQSYLVFNTPLLPPRVNVMDIKGLRGRDWELNLSLRRGNGGTQVDITKKTGSVRVLTVK